MIIVYVCFSFNVIKYSYLNDHLVHQFNKNGRNLSNVDSDGHWKKNTKKDV